MLELIDVPEGRTMEDMVKELNHSLAVPAWQAPFGEPDDQEPADPEDEGAPWWWDGAEDASQSFLRSQGVVL